MVRKMTTARRTGVATTRVARLQSLRLGNGRNNNPTRPAELSPMRIKVRFSISLGIQWMAEDVHGSSPDHMLASLAWKLAASFFLFFFGS